MRNFLGQTKNSDMMVTNLEKKQGDFFLCINHLEIREPRIYGLIGPNGCGKSTTAKLLSGVLPPDRGTIDLEGLDPRNLSLLPQKPYMMRDTVYQNLVFPLKLRGIPIDREDAQAQLDGAGFRGRYRQQARSLSGGEQQKLALLRAFIFHPRFLIADEAMTELDMDSLDFFERMMREHQRNSGGICLIISHQMAHVERLCEYLFFMNQGSLLAEGPTPEILRSPDPRIRRYLRVYGGEE
jgi:ABC-type multidrug transport system ATPase subunit